MTVFDSRYEAVVFLRKRLSTILTEQTEIGPDLEAVLVGIPRQNRPWDPLADIDVGQDHYLKGFRWIIHDEDLKTVDLVSETIKAAAALLVVQQATSSTVTPSVVALFLVAFKFVDICRKKRIKLTEAETAIVTVLSANPEGLEFATLVWVLQSSDKTVTAEATRGHLGNLANKYTADGSNRALAVDLGNDTWRLSGV